jgi:hypothetical protein
MERTWTPLSKDYLDSPERIDEILAEAGTLTWLERGKDTLEGPFSPISMLNAWLAQDAALKRGCKRLGYGGILEYPDGPDETATYGLLSVEIGFKSGSRLRLVALDLGIAIAVLYLEDYTAEEVAAWT